MKRPDHINVGVGAGSERSPAPTSRAEALRFRVARANNSIGRSASRLATSSAAGWLAARERVLRDDDNVVHAQTIVEGAADQVGALFDERHRYRLARLDRTARITRFELAVTLRRYRQVWILRKMCRRPGDLFYDVERVRDVFGEVANRDLRPGRKGELL